MKRVASVLVVFLFGLASLGLAQSLTADEILKKVEDRGFFGTGRGFLYTSLVVEIQEKGQPSLDYAFRVWAKEYPDGTVKTLLLYAAPEDVAGTLFLAHIPEEGSTRMWLWLPELGLLKELVGETERKGEFIAGSGITYDDLARGFSYREGYTATLAGEETMSGAVAWRLDLEPVSPGQDWSQIRLWVHQEEFIVLRAEFVDRSGRLARVLSVPELVQDELGPQPARLVVEDLLKEGRATVEIQARSAAEIPDAYFEPHNLGTLDL